MNLLPKGKYWYADYFAIDNSPLDIYKTPGTSQYKVTPLMVADLLLPLAKAHYRYDPISKVWYRFNGKHFAPSKQLFTDLKDSVHDFKSDVQTANGAMDYLPSIANVHTPQFLPKIKDIFQESIDLHIDIKDFDSNLHAVNTPNGYYDLLTLDKTPNSSDHLCRQILAIAPKDDEDGKNCPNYLQHLKYLAQGDIEVMNWLEDISGYLLTGETFAREFYWLCGISQSGKSQLGLVWREIMGGIGDSSYFISAPSTLFAQKNHEPHTEIWYRLIGKRFILVEELKDGRWNESVMKEFTSGNPFNACKKFGDTLSFLPVGKVLFLSNKQPMLDASDSGIVSRLNLLECTQQIPEDKKVAYFGDRVLFKQEGPYILNRMMKAAQRVLLREKMLRPTRVIDNTKEYVQSNNLVELFMQDGCVTGHDYSETYKHLHTACTLWCTENGYDCPSLTTFRKILKDLRYKTGRNHAARVVVGIALNDVYKKKIGQVSYSAYN